jgi:hypothetical protein
MKKLGQMTLSEAMPLLKEISFIYSLNLGKVKDFNMAKKMLIITYFND